MVAGKFGLVSGIVTLVFGGISAITGIIATCDSIKNGNKRAVLTGRAIGDQYAKTKDMLDHPEKYKEDDKDDYELEEL